MALFFLSTGSMAGMAVMTPLLTLSITLFDWQTTLVGFAISFAVVTVPAALFIIKDEVPQNADLLPATPGSAPSINDATPAELTFGAAMRTSPFWKTVPWQRAPVARAKLPGTDPARRSASRHRGTAGPRPPTRPARAALYDEHAVTR